MLESKREKCDIFKARILIAWAYITCDNARFFRVPSIARSDDAIPVAGSRSASSAAGSFEVVDG